ncbi:MAG: imidazolonepropionase [Candidatus Marinimicrobia bacterium]|jgi:imidazolonepropionase|nr:imidazolonepropionase [Candidatus Neomarinimicrobiota bacterium]MDP6991550.1 imidazolonepropionase [Candidatus Neomarinimicrobiota bacterium]
MDNHKSILITNIGRLVSANTDGVTVVENTSVLIENGQITAIGEGAAEHKIDCGGKMVTAGFVDSHTHPVFFNKRDEEYAMRLAGSSYEEIAEKGGGIVSSVAGVRNASKNALVDKVSTRMDRFISMGTTTVESKSGYGLDTVSELKSLEVIDEVNESHAIDMVPTFMGGHAFPNEFVNDHDAYINLICDEMVPAVAEQGIAIFNDVFCEEGYFTVEQSRRILETGKEYGLKPRLHADEFVDSGAAELAGEVGAFSADHLMAVSDAGINRLAENNVVASLLPGTTFFLGKTSYAPARQLMDAGLTVALATDFNPGSCHIQSMPFIMTLACMHMGMTVEEAYQSATYHGAKALGLEHEIGSIDVGKKADLVVWNLDSLLDIPYHVSNHSIQKVIKNGNLVFGA